MHMFRYFFLIASSFYLSNAFGAGSLQCPIPTDISPFNSSISANNSLCNAYWASVLGWLPTTVTPKNLCGGHYAEPRDISSHPNPAPIAESAMNITSTGPVHYNLNGNSTIEGNVTLTQPGREIRADKITLTPDPNTKQVTQISLQGNVRFQEAGKLIVGRTAYIDLIKKMLTFKQGGYHLVKPSPTGNLDTWGTAEEAHRESPLFSWFKQATYTTCPPTNPAWHLKSSYITLNNETGRGTAKNVLIYAENTPFFYIPYFSFPIDKRRYSGFLYPSFGYDNLSGAFFTIPYYFNLAPNYDDTLTLKPMSKRGVLTENSFRYLTSQNTGFLEWGFIPDDKVFATFKTTENQFYPANSYNTPFLKELNKDSNDRASVSFHNNSILNEQWSASTDINYVTDDYYFQDLGNNLASIDTDQLLNQAILSYQNEYWQFSSKVQIWQTLHQINQTFAQDQYKRLPELNLSSLWPDQPYGLMYGFNSQWVNFTHVNDFFTDTPYPTGDRLHLNPQVSLPIIKSGGFFTPTLALDVTNYSVNHNGTLDTNTLEPTIIPNGDPALNTVRTLPIFDIDSGLYLDRHISLGKHDYAQTLEPRLFYLFVPIKNQNNIPVFDTVLPPFSFDEVFRTNRFIGYDRVGDANQLSFGLTSRILDGYTGEDKVDTSIGAIYYFHKHTVCLYPDCSDDPTINERASPVAGQLTYHLNPRLSVIGNAAWDPNQGRMNNDSIHLQYAHDSKRIINIGYDYIQNGDILNADNSTSSENNLNRIDLSISWPLPNTTHWQIVSDFNYNISHAHPETYLYGLEYESCCWAVRLVNSRVLAAEDSLGNTTFRSAYYVQFLLKGLGAVGNTNSKLLINSIPGYHDAFKST